MKSKQGLNNSSTEHCAPCCNIRQVTDEEVAAAKKNMLADVYTMLEAPLNQIENMGSQVS